MWWTIFVALMVLYVLGMASSYDLGGLIHVLPLLAMAVLTLKIYHPWEQFLKTSEGDRHGPKFNQHSDDEQR